MQFNDIKQEIADSGWESNADKLFLELLKEIIDTEDCIGKEFTIKYIVNKLDNMRDSGKINIENDSSYNMAKKVMFSNRKGRDYFIFINKEAQEKLNGVLRRDNSGFEWSKYIDKKVVINPKYNMVSVAGKNEKRFIELCKKYELDGLLNGKKTYYSNDSAGEKVSISVDNSIVYKNKEVLIEIDSGNMPKLIVGQYTLLNILCEKPEEKVFIVIHYYNDYRPQRTIKNLKLVADKLFNSKQMRFKAYYIKEFEEICKKNEHNEKGFIRELLKKQFVINIDFQ